MFQAVNDTLPGTQLDPSSITYEQSFRCNPGEVVVDDQCVPCPPGTYFNFGVCSKCPIGQFNPEAAQRQCVRCPTIRGIEGVTEGLGATKSSECKEKCTVRFFYVHVVLSRLHA